MKKIRIGNDFVFNWAIERGGLPEDLSSVLEKHLHLSVFGKRVELIEGVDYDITGNVIRIEVTPTIANILGTYKAEFHYILPDNGLIDEDRKCAVDVDAFQIVARTAQADDPSEFTVTSDMAIAFKGDKGDSAYQVWLDAGNTGTKEDYFAYLRQPAIDAGASISELEDEIQVSEGLRVQAESERGSRETARVQSESERLSAEIIRQSNEGNRIENEDTRVQNEAERISKEGIRQSNEIDRVEAEGLRVQAESERAQAEIERQATIQEAVTATNLANEKADLANTAAQNANEAADSALTATQEATTAASLADTARLAIQDDLALKANHGYVLGEEETKTLKQVETDTSIKIENVLIGGSFEDDSNGDGIADGGIVIVSPSTNRDTIHLLTNDCIIGSKAQKFVGGVKGGMPYLKLKNVDSVTDKYYYSFWTKSTVAGGFWRVSNGNNRANIPTSQNVYRRDSIVLNNIEILTVNMAFYSTLTFKPLPEGEEVYIDGLMQINLTKIFGVGNEPTKEEMDLLISTLGIDYFEGEITIPAQKIMQWQLALIRKNKNAILALGGTII